MRLQSVTLHVFLIYNYIYILPHSYYLQSLKYERIIILYSTLQILTSQIFHQTYHNTTKTCGCPSILLQYIQIGSINYNLRVINKIMGNQCCATQFDNYQIKAQKVEMVQVQTRQGFPSEKIGIKLSDIGQIVHPVSKIDEINKLHFKVVDYDKKFKGSFRINKQPIPFNKLPQTYYIPSLNMFYVGEWVFDGRINDNVPGGIGRLYEEETISEGVFKTLILNPEEVQMTKEREQPIQNQSRYKKNSNGSIVKENRFETANSNLLSPRKQSNNKLDRLLKSNRQKIADDDMTFVIKLHGPGRIYSKQLDSKEQIEMQGQFYEGILNGKGVLKIMQEGAERYYYNGLWKHGQKHGKGVEKTSNYKYEGNFYQNSKHGKGIQTFINSMKDEHDVQKDMEKMEKKMITEEENIKMEAFKKVAIREHREKLIQTQLNKKEYPASKIQLRIERSLIIDMNFTLERTYRTVFTQSYSGDFQNGKMDGQGTYVWPNGKTYKGKWVKNRLNGEGQFYWPDGSYFQGKYQNDERNGQGIMIWSVLKRYRGNWAFGLRHGYGQSIEINEKQQKMTIKGSIWDRDKVKKKLFQQTLPIPGWNNVQQIERFIQQQFLGQNQKIRPKKSKQKGKGNEQNQLKLLSLKDIKDSSFINQIQNSLSKLKAVN